MIETVTAIAFLVFVLSASAVLLALGYAVWRDTRRG